MIRLLTIMLSVVAFSATAHPAPSVLEDFEPPTYEKLPSPATTSPTYSLSIVTVFEDNHYKDVFYYRGSIETNTTEVIDFFAKQYPHIKEISLNSPGGVAYESFELGQWFSNNDMSTTVSPRSICLSACAIAFIGGKDYMIDGTLGFHNAWISIDQETAFNLDELNSAYKSGQLIGTQLSYYFRVNGFHDALALQVTMKTDAQNFIIFTHEDELLEFFSRATDHEDTINHYIDPSRIPEGTLDNIKVMDMQAMIAWIDDPLNAPTRGRQVVRFDRLYPQRAQPKPTTAQ